MLHEELTSSCRSVSIFYFGEKKKKKTVHFKMTPKQEKLKHKHRDSIAWPIYCMLIMLCGWQNSFVGHAYFFLVKTMKGKNVTYWTVWKGIQQVTTITGWRGTSAAHVTLTDCYNDINLEPPTHVQNWTSVLDEATPKIFKNHKGSPVPFYLATLDCHILNETDYTTHKIHGSIFCQMAFQVF